MMMKRAVPFGLILAATALLTACSNEPAPVTGTAGEVSAEILTVKPQSVAEHYYASGTVTSDHRIAISSRLSGYIRSITVREGEKVSKGQLLVKIDPVDTAQALTQASADLANAKADYLRFKELLAADAISRQQFDQAELRYKIARSRVAQASNQLAYAEIKSPVDGIVVSKQLNTGDLANPGSPIMVIEDPAKLLVETSVSEQYITTLKVGDEVDLNIPAVEDYVKGHIRQVVNAADPGTHQYLVKIAIDNTDKVRPGMFAEVGFRTGTKFALIVPADAIVHRAGLTGIYLVDDQGITHYRQIRTGNRSEKGIEVVAGLQQGDRIAWHAAQPLRSDMKVTEGK